MPKFSIIIPVYNAENYLEEVLDSVIHQSFTCFEVLIVNDRSTDTSLAIIQDYRKKDARISLIDLKKKTGVARNLASIMPKNIGIIY